MTAFLLLPLLLTPNGAAGMPVAVIEKSDMNSHLFNNELAKLYHIVAAIPPETRERFDAARAEWEKAYRGTMISANWHTFRHGADAEMRPLEELGDQAVPLILVAAFGDDDFNANYELLSRGFDPGGALSAQTGDKYFRLTRFASRWLNLQPVPDGLFNEPGQPVSAWDFSPLGIDTILLPAEYLHKLQDAVDTVPAAIRRHIDELFEQHSWGALDPRYCSGNRRLDPGLTVFGDAALPVVLSRALLPNQSFMLSPPLYFPLLTYEKIQKDSNLLLPASLPEDKTVGDDPATERLLRRDERNRAARIVLLWLDSGPRLRDVATPDEMRRLADAAAAVPESVRKEYGVHFEKWRHIRTCNGSPTCSFRWCHGNRTDNGLDELAALGAPILPLVLADAFDHLPALEIFRTIVGTAWVSPPHTTNPASALHLWLANQELFANGSRLTIPE